MGFPSGVPVQRSSVRFDKSAMNPFQAVDATAALQTTYSTLQSITGRGYLDVAMLGVGVSFVGTLRITVDGVVKFEGATSSTAGTGTGVVKRDLLVPIGSASTIGVINPVGNSNVVALTSGAVFAYPYTANAVANAVAILADSIYFNSSLLIEAKTAGTAGTNHKYYFSGGFQ